MEKKKNDDAKCFRGNDGRRRRRRSYPQYPLTIIIYLCTAAADDVDEKRERVACIAAAAARFSLVFAIIFCFASYTTTDGGCSYVVYTSSLLGALSPLS